MYEFNVKTQTNFDEKNYYSKLEVYVHTCYIKGCDNCMFGTLDTEICYECDIGYRNIDGKCKEDKFLLFLLNFVFAVSLMILILGFVELFIGVH